MNTEAEVRQLTPTWQGKSQQQIVRGKRKDRGKAIRKPCGFFFRIKIIISQYNDTKKYNNFPNLRQTLLLRFSDAEQSET